MGVLSFVFGISLWRMGLIGSDFFPSGDQSEIDITLTMPPSTSLEATNQAALEIDSEPLRGTTFRVRFAPTTGVTLQEHGGSITLNPTTD